MYHSHMTAKQARDFLDLRAKLALRDSLGLTDFQPQVYNLRILHGLYNYQIAMKLNCSDSTVARAIRVISDKLRARHLPQEM